jgi:hypothetical protein
MDSVKGLQLLRYIRDIIYLFIYFHICRKKNGRKKKSSPAEIYLRVCVLDIEFGIVCITKTIVQS